ncbi:MAG: glycosyltransferase [Bdellovibrionales bacterium]|nr:glycosyltransferase [Bdellovibrionales bacterium]
MHLLFLAPEPFFQERGTPIAVRLALEVLAKRNASRSQGEPPDRIDLLTYNEGIDIELTGVNILRISTPRILHGVGPGISLKKLVCDLFFLIDAIRLVSSRRNDQYTLVHAVEESVFVAYLLKLIFGIPYIYDMDSSLAMQLTEKWYLLKPFHALFALLERMVIKSSSAVVPVCDALAAIADRNGSKFTSVLSDFSLMEENPRPVGLRKELQLQDDDELILYIGNLEPYQGIDLLMDSFKKLRGQNEKAHLVIVGGREEHIETYQKKAKALDITSHVHLIGPRPLKDLGSYLVESDILVSPRVRGNNTPMKIYSFLHAGRPIVATAIYSHTQVLSHEVAELAQPNSDDFSRALSIVLNQPARAQEIAKNALKLARERYTYSAFSQQLNRIYDTIIPSVSRSKQSVSKTGKARST